MSRGNIGMSRGQGTISSSPKESRKVFIQRDYSTGTRVKFSLDFPPELIGIVS